MKQVALNKVINKETKYYGLKLGGLVFGVILGLSVLIIVNMTAAIIGVLIGYSVGSWFSTLLHLGKLQRFIYWNMPVRALFGNKYLPPSHMRIFM